LIRGALVVRRIYRTAISVTAARARRPIVIHRLDTHSGNSVGLAHCLEPRTWRTIAGALEQVEDLLAEGIKNRELIVEVKLWLESINSTIEHEAATDCAPLSQTAQGNGSIVTTPVLSGLHYRYART
jgi:hypothetical protein